MSLSSQLLHIIWPHRCVVCGRLGVHVCDACLGSLADLTASFCLECGNGAPCGVHADSPRLCAASRYSGKNRAIIHKMKYDGCYKIARLLGEALGERFGRPMCDALVPIPLHIGTDREYNQAELMALGLSHKWDIRVDNILEWSVRTERQTVRNSSDRGLPQGAMMVKPGLTPGVVYLADDVYTTGSTMRAAHQALTASGYIVAGAIVWSMSGRRRVSG